MEILGNIVTTCGSEVEAMNHRASKSFGVFWKWSKVLLCRQTDIAKRMIFWRKTVGASMLWGLESTRSHNTTHKILIRAQRQQVVRMMGIKGRVFEGGIVEDWIDWHRRRYREAKRVIASCDIDIITILKARRMSFAGHVIRFGLHPKETHIVKFILLWRCLEWWNHQKRHNKTILEWQRFMHTSRFGQPRRWEAQFPKDYWTIYLKDKEQTQDHR